MPSITAVLAAKLIEQAARRGAARDALCTLAGLAPGQTIALDARVPIAVYYELWARAARAVDDPGLPIEAALSGRIEDFEVFGFAVMTSGLGREALLRTIRYVRLITDSGHWELAERRGEARMRWCREGERSLGHRLANEAAIAELVHGMRQVLSDGFNPTRVTFRHRAPRSLAAHERFFRCPLVFEGNDDAFSFPSSVLSRVPHAANPRLNAYLEMQADRILGALPDEPDLLARAERAIASSLASGTPPASSISKSLGVSDRTLRRQLEERGTSFRALVSAVRRKRAEELLRAGRHSVGEIAFLLGFAGIDVFSRAFRRWSGSSPTEFRSRGA
jgi:AraC-like DNA-binding protein